MKKKLIHLLVLVLLMAMIPSQAFAWGNGAGSAGGNDNNSLSVAINPKPFTSAKLHSPYALNLTQPINYANIDSIAYCEETTGTSQSFGRITHIYNIQKVTVSYKVSGPLQSAGTSTLKHMGGTKWGGGTIILHLTEYGTYTVVANFTATYVEKKSGKTQTFKKSATITAVVQQPAGPKPPTITWTNFISSGTVNKDYPFKAVAKANTSTNPNNKITSLTYSVNSSIAKLKQSDGSATFNTPVASSAFYIEAKAKDSNGLTATSRKAFVINGVVPIVTLTAKSPLQVKELTNVVMSVDTKGMNLSYTFGNSWRNPAGDLAYGFNSDTTYTKPAIGKSGSFVSSMPGEYLISVTPKNLATGEVYPKTQIAVQVMSGLQAVISVKSSVMKGTSLKAKDVSVVQGGNKIVNAQWSIIDPTGKPTPFVFPNAGSTVPINTAILGKHTVTLTVRDNLNNVSKSTKTVNVTATGLAEEVEEPEGILPDNVDDLLPFEDITIPDAASSKKHMLPLSQRGVSGSCKNDSKLNHVGETASAFQYWKLSINRKEYSGNIPVISKIKENEIVRNNNSNSINVTFDKEGIYQVYASKWWYCEANASRTHKKPCTHTPSHSGGHFHCNYIKYISGAVIEKHDEIGPYEVIITPDLVGKVITFDSDWKQESVKTESFLIE